MELRCRVRQVQETLDKHLVSTPSSKSWWLSSDDVWDLVTVKIHICYKLSATPAAASFVSPQSSKSHMNWLNLNGTQCLSGRLPGKFSSPCNRRRNREGMRKSQVLIDNIWDRSDRHLQIPYVYMLSGSAGPKEYFMERSFCRYQSGRNRTRDQKRLDIPAFPKSSSFLESTQYTITVAVSGKWK